MRYSIVAASAALVAGVNANYGYGYASNVTYTTEVVTAFTTYCPSSTQLVHNQKTYTVTEATTLTITNCPCTVTKPVIIPSIPASSTPIIVSTKPIPVVSTSSTPVVVVSSSTTPVSTTPVQTTPVTTTSPVKPSVPVVYTSTPVVPIGTAPVSSVPAVVYSSVPGAPPVPVSTVPVLPSKPVSTPVYLNSTVPNVPTSAPPAGTGKPSGGSPTTTSKLSVFTGAANKFVAPGAGLAGVFGLAAFML